VIRHFCRRCGSELQSNEVVIGEKVQCPNCSAWSPVPKTSEPPGARGWLSKRIWLYTPLAVAAALLIFLAYHVMTRPEPVSEEDRKLTFGKPAFVIVETLSPDGTCRIKGLLPTTKIVFEGFSLILNPRPDVPTALGDFGILEISPDGICQLKTLLRPVKQVLDGRDGVPEALPDKVKVVFDDFSVILDLRRGLARALADFGRATTVLRDRMYESTSTAHVRRVSGVLDTGDGVPEPLRDKVTVDLHIPGAVLVVGAREGVALEGQSFAFREIILVNSRRQYVLAPAGTPLVLPEGDPFEVPDNSKLPPGMFPQVAPPSLRTVRFPRMSPPP